MRRRTSSDEHYVLDLCDEILGEVGQRQYTEFDWLRGDTGRRLQVDAFTGQGHRRGIPRASALMLLSRSRQAGQARCERDPSRSTTTAVRPTSRRTHSGEWT